MQQCTFCGKLLNVVGADGKLEKSFWMRELPDILFCRECWYAPEATNANLLRHELAVLFIRMRQQPNGRVEARRTRDSLRGTGVPAKLPLCLWRKGKVV